MVTTIQCCLLPGNETYVLATRAAVIVGVSGFIQGSQGCVSSPAELLSELGIREDCAADTLKWH
jgi:hypothetical protein